MHHEVPALIARGALFVVNHSAGKDSQAMTAYLRQVVPAEQLVVVHAELPGVDWPGLEEHIRSTIGNLPLVTCVAEWKDGRTKTFMDMVDSRQMWPSPKYRQCTSDLKRTPIEKVIRRLAKERGNGLIVNCTGIRAEESSSRSKQKPFTFNKRQSKAGREVYDWMPIHTWTEAQVWAAIEMAGQEPHWAYAEGMTRLSCCFCIMSSRKDLQTAARLKPELAQAYIEKEREIDQTFTMPPKGKDRVFLDDILYGDWD